MNTLPPSTTKAIGILASLILLVVFHTYEARAECVPNGSWSYYTGEVIVNTCGDWLEIPTHSETCPAAPCGEYINAKYWWRECRYQEAWHEWTVYTFYSTEEGEYCPDSDPVNTDNGLSETTTWSESSAIECLY